MTAWSYGVAAHGRVVADTQGIYLTEQRMVALARPVSHGDNCGHCVRVRVRVSVRRTRWLRSRS